MSFFLHRLYHIFLCRFSYNDTFNILSGTDTITDLGNGTDVLAVSAGAVLNATLSGTTPSWTIGSDTNSGTTTITAATGTTTATVNLASLTNTEATGSVKLDVSLASSTTTLTMPTTASQKITVLGGTGADTIVQSGALTANVSIDGGTGADILKVGGTPDISAATITSVETLDFANLNGAQSVTLTPTQFAAFTTLASTGGAVAGEKVIFSTAGTVTIDTAHAGLLVYKLASGINTVNATALPTVATATIDASSSSAVNTINLLSGTLDMSANKVTVTGGSGVADVLNFTGNNAITVAGAVGLSGVEAINFANTSTNVSFVTGAATIASSSTAITVTNVASTGTFKFDAVLDVGGDKFNITNLATGNSTINGGTGADTLTGGAAIETIAGSDGADVIRGGGAADNLTGGKGSDKFIFEATATANGADTITDFKVGAAGTASASAAGDIMSFVNFLSGGSVLNSVVSTKYVPTTASAAKKYVAAAAASGSTGTAAKIAVADGKVLFVTTSAAITSAGAAVTALGAGGNLDSLQIAANAKAVIIDGVAGATTAYVYYVTNDATAAIAATGEVALVGTVTLAASGISNFIAANVVFA